LEADTSFRFHAGQYLLLVHPNRSVPFSIATSPHHLPALEIHYRPITASADAAIVDALIAERQDLTIEGPFGDVFVDDAAREPLLLIAGGTGVAQAGAIVDFLRTRRQRARVTLLWSVARSTDFYCDAEIRAFADASWCTIRPVVDSPGTVQSAGENAAVAWLRAHGAPDAAQVILCGAPPFVYAVTDALEALGIPRSRMRSDVFSYAPRPGR